MPLEISYSEARNNLASLLDRVTDDREVVVINRRGHERVAVISADELNSVLESLYLLRSPKNGRRLMNAINRAEAGTTKPSSIDELRKEFGIEKGERK